MAKNGLFEYYSQLPTWAKGVIAVTAVVGTGLVAWNVYKKIHNANMLKNSDKTTRDAKDEFKRLMRDGQKLSHPELVYQTAANSIQNFLDGCETVNTEYDVVKTIQTTVKKPIDWYFLVMKFGSRMIDNCGVWTGETAYALPELIKDQLGQFGSFDSIQTYLKKIGVTI